jgi:5-methylcytosine-specific restriction endonuclease McrA
MNKASRKQAERLAEKREREVFREHYPTYQAYLKSEHWQSRRRVMLKLAGNLCGKCGSAESLHVHHKNYERVGRETAADLEVLCERCHKAEHWEWV